MKRSQLTYGFLLLLQLELHHHLIHASLRLPYCPYPVDCPSSANLSTTWTNISYEGVASCILSRWKERQRVYLVCGLFCDNLEHKFVVGVFVFLENSYSGEMLWSANRDSPAKDNATLQLTSDGDLALKDAHGSLAWSTNTAGKGVVGMKLTERGNLVLFNAKNAVVWQSFDHPTDTLVSGQSLLKGQRLTADVSDSNRSRGRVYISSVADWFGAFVDSNPPQLYFNISRFSELGLFFHNVTHKAFTFVAQPSNWSDPDGPTFQFLRLDYHGNFLLYVCDDTYCISSPYIRTGFLSYCGLPMVCGSYGICMSEQQCICPKATDANTTFFQMVNDTIPNLGCSPVFPPSCESPRKHMLLPLKGVGYFLSSADDTPYPNFTTEERCREACLSNCSCKAAIFLSSDSPFNASNGRCTLPQEIFPLSGGTSLSNAYIKVQVPPPSPSPSPTKPVVSTSDKTSRSKALIIGATVGVVVGMLLIVCIAAILYRKADPREIEENDEEEDFPQLPGMPTRFSYECMRSATKNFNKKLGGGGFGSVFDGVLADGTRVAIKQLETVNQGKREFLAEVETIGSIHHLNLVRLVGFCVEKWHRLLVYEHMSNGSLDKWIFKNDENRQLSWEVLRRIIYQVAKGLTYLHEECRQKIAHLDIKPENILLDSNFDAKVSDFGLAKLIDRDQSAVMTMMRGTPGYLAPEWLTSMITEKVDVYSFGIVIIEIVCGSKNIDFSQPEETVHLLPLIKEKAMAGELLDLVDKSKIDVQRDGKDLEEMLKLAIWCVQYVPSKRPSMSTVVKVLEGATEITPDLDYNFSIPVQKLVHKAVDDSSGSTTILPSILSGPR